MGAGDTFGYIVYTTDEGEDSNIVVSQAVALGIAEDFGTIPWPDATGPAPPRKDRRHMTCKGTNPEDVVAHQSFPICDPADIANGTWKRGVTFTVTNANGDTTWTVLGVFGEKKPARALF